MNISVRWGFQISVATITAATVAFVPSVTIAAPQSMPASTPTVRVRSAPVQLTAATQTTAAPHVLPNLLTDWLRRIVVPPSASAPFPTPTFEDAIGGTSIDSTIKNVYNAVEPWVRYGFELGAYAVGWVPYVGWLAPQVMIFYDFGERIARSITFNVADWLGGKISFWDGLVNVVMDTIDSFVRLAQAQLNFWLPSLPPLPPIGPLAGAEMTTLTVTSTEPSADPDASTLMTATRFQQRTPIEPEPIEPIESEPVEAEPTPTKANPAGQPTAAVLPQVTAAEDTEDLEDPEVKPTLTTTGTTSTTTTSNGVSAQGEVRSGIQTVMTGGVMSGTEENAGAGRATTTPTAANGTEPEPTKPAATEQLDPSVDATPPSGSTEGNQTAEDTKDEAAAAA